MRKRLFEIVHKAQPGDGISRIYDIILVCTAVLSVVPFLFSRDALEGTSADIVNIIDTVTVYILIFDYTALWLTHDFKRQRLGKKGDWRSFFLYPITPLAIIDLLAILPSITVLPSELMFLRLLRLFKIFRFSKAFESIGNVFKNESRIFISMGVLFALYIFLAALVMYLTEQQTFGNFITALYWSTTSLVTIGYGDLAPTSDVGRAINIISALLGVILVALPTAIITSGFMNEVRHEKVHKVASFGAIREAWKDIKALHLIQRAKRFKDWLDSRKKVKVYLIVIVICVAIDFIISILSKNIVWSPEYLGPMLCAVLLEPAAGVFVAFFASMGIAINSGSENQIIQFVVPAICAIAFGRLFARNRHPGILRTFVVLLIMSIVAVFLAFCLWYLMEERTIYFTDFKILMSLAEGQEGTWFRFAAIYFSMLSQFISCLFFAAFLVFIRFLIRGKWLDPHMHYNYDENEPILACEYVDNAPVIRVRTNKLGADLMMRSVDEVASDLLVTPNLVEAYLKGKNMQMRKSDHMVCPFEADVEALIEDWLATRASDELQYIACDECGRWYHIDNLHARVRWDKYAEERVTTFLCAHCRTFEQEIAETNLDFEEKDAKEKIALKKIP